MLDIQLISEQQMLTSRHLACLFDWDRDLHLRPHIDVSWCRVQLVYIMRRQRRGARALVLVLVFGFVKALEADTLTGDGSIDTFKLADAFENVSEENVTELLDEIVVPASLESEAAVPPVEEEPRDLRPLEDSTANRHARSLTTAAPYGGALVAVQATALLVGGAAVVVLFIAKIKRRYSADQCGYDEDLSDPMLQSLLYSDMDYAAI